MNKRPTPTDASLPVTIPLHTGQPAAQGQRPTSLPDNEKACHDFKLR